MPQKNQKFKKDAKALDLGQLYTASWMQFLTNYYQIWHSDGWHKQGYKKWIHFFELIFILNLENQRRQFGHSLKSLCHICNTSVEKTIITIQIGCWDVSAISDTTWKVSDILIRFSDVDEKWEPPYSCQVWIIAPSSTTGRLELNIPFLWKQFVGIILDLLLSYLFYMYTFWHGCYIKRFESLKERIPNLPFLCLDILDCFLFNLLRVLILIHLNIIWIKLMLLKETNFFIGQNIQ